MGLLVMSFRGICMHIATPPQPLPHNLKHRVVAVDADQGAQTVRFGPLPPHVCYLETAPEVAAALQAAGFQANAEGRFRLDRANISIGNATGDWKPPQLDRVPRLTDYAEIELRPELYQDADVPSSADCYVDMNNGEVTNTVFDEGGVYTTWTVDTADEQPLLVIKVAGQAPVTVAIPSTQEGERLSDGVPGSIVVHNSTTNRADKEFDFALHYLVAVNGIPTVYKEMFPTDPGLAGTRGDIRVDLTSSCSNSQFP